MTASYQTSPVYLERLTLAYCIVLRDNQDTALQNTMAKTVLGPNQQIKHSLVLGQPFQYQHQEIHQNHH